MQDERTKKYYIGHGLFCLCATAKRHNKISNIAQPYLEHLVDVFGETSNLTILDGTDVVYVGQAESTNLLKMFTQMGARVPFYCTGGGKAMVAHLPEKRIEEILTNTVFRRFTDHTINDGEVLKRELKSIRIQGYAFDNEEREDGVTCIAAPVFDAYGIPVAAVSISGPTRRLRDKQFHPLLMNCSVAHEKYLKHWGMSAAAAIRLTPLAWVSQFIPVFCPCAAAHFHSFLPAFTNFISLFGRKKSLLISRFL